MNEVKNSGCPGFVQGARPNVAPAFPATLFARAQNMSQEPDQSLIPSILDILSEGFVLFDENRQFVFCNQTYKSLYSGLLDMFVAGTDFEDIVRAGIDRGQIIASEFDGPNYISDRLASIDESARIHEHQLRDGRWLRVSEQEEIEVVARQALPFQTV